MVIRHQLRSRPLLSSYSYPNLNVLPAQPRRPRLELSLKPRLDRQMDDILVSLEQLIQ